MKLTEKDKKLLVIAAGLLIFVIAYFLIGNNLSESALKVENENRELKSQMAILDNLTSQKVQFESDIDAFKQEIQVASDSFPAGLKPEDQILYARSFSTVIPEDKRAVISYIETPTSEAIPLAQPAPDTTLSIGQDITGEFTAQESVTYDDIPDTSLVNLYKSTSVVQYTVAYEGLKDMLKSIIEDGNRKSISDVSMVYNEKEGNITGSISIDYYYMTGTNKEYEEPNLPSVPRGTSDVFHSAAIVERTDEESNEQAGGDTANDTTDDTADEEGAEETPEE